MFGIELVENSMADKVKIDLEELQVQTSDMYISDNLIGEPITNSTNSLSTDISEKTVPENQMTINEDSVSKDVTEEEMVAVECETEKTDKNNSVQMDDNDGIRVTGSDEGEFVLLNADGESDNHRKCNFFTPYLQEIDKTSIEGQISVA